MSTPDLILRGGHVIDPSQNIDGVMDVGFKDGKATGVAKSIKGGPKTAIRDVKGYIVTPGLIDLHTHVYWGGTSLGIDADEFCRKSGVTTSIDTGSAGPGNFAGFRKHVIERSEARILAYLHVSFAGIFGFSKTIMVGESKNMELMAPREAAEVAAANRDVIVGIKVRVGRHSSSKPGSSPAQHRTAGGRGSRHAADGAHRRTAAVLRGGARHAAAGRCPDQRLPGRSPTRRAPPRAR